MKAVLRGEFMALSSFIKLIESPEINDLTLYLKALEKKNKSTPKAEDRK